MQDFVRYMMVALTVGEPVNVASSQWVVLWVRRKLELTNADRPHLGFLLDWDESILNLG